MGGAVGHLQHLYDNRELTFADIKDIFNSAAAGTLEKVTEKLDGMNLVFSHNTSNNQLIVARSSGDIKSGGMDAKTLATKFYGRANIADAFNSAFDILEKSIELISDVEKRSIFGDAQTWYSIEIIYAQNPNVINYDANYIVFHGWPVFEITPDNRVIKKDSSEGVDALVSYVDKMQKAVTLRNWKIVGPSLLQMKKISDGSLLASAAAELNSIMNSAGVDDSSSIEDYLINVLSEDVASLNVSNDVSEMIVLRLLEKGPKLTDIKKMVPVEKYNEIANYVKSSKPLLKKAIQPIENLVCKFSVELLMGMKSALVSDHDEEILRLRHEVSKSINTIESSGNIKAIDTLKTQMEKLESIENVSSTIEGIVFMYKGNAYKFTGAFAPINQILGLFKYGNVTMSENLHKNIDQNTNIRKHIRQYVAMLIEASKEGKGTKFDKEEKEAFDAYVASKEKLVKWKEAMEKYNAWKRVWKNKINTDQAQAEKPIFPLGTSELTRQTTLEKKIKDAQNAYAYYEPSASSYVYQSTFSKKKRDSNEDDVVEAYQPLINWTPELYANKWTKWPDEVKLSGIEFDIKSKKEKTRLAEVGVGRGERWLAYIFGGKVMGQNESYDIVMPNGTKCEVKEINARYATIRPGTKGLRAYEEARNDITSVIKQLQDFLEIVDALGEDFMNEISPIDRQRINYIKEFVNEEYQPIVVTGEISHERIGALRKILKIIKEHFRQNSSEIEARKSISINRKELEVPGSTYKKIIRQIEKDMPGVVSSNLSTTELWDLVLQPLQSHAFADYTAYINLWYDKVNVEKIFEGTDGVFIVNENKGFYWIPIQDVNENLEFTRVSQGLPMLKFLDF